MMKQNLFDQIIGKTIEEFFVENGNYVVRVKGDEREFVICPKYGRSENESYGECLVLPNKSK